MCVPHGVPQHPCEVVQDGADAHTHEHSSCFVGCAPRPHVRRECVLMRLHVCMCAWVCVCLWGAAAATRASTSGGGSSLSSHVEEHSSSISTASSAPKAAPQGGSSAHLPPPGLVVTSAALGSVVGASLVTQNDFDEVRHNPLVVGVNNSSARV